LAGIVDSPFCLFAGERAPRATVLPPATQPWARLVRYGSCLEAGLAPEGLVAAISGDRRGVRRELGLASMFCAGLLVGVGLFLGEDAARKSPHSAAERSQPGWFEIAKLSVRSFMDDRIQAVAAAVTFYFLLAIFPALSAFASLYGLVADVGDAQRQMTALAGVLPAGALSVIGDELARLAATDHGALGLAFAASVLISIWSANAGVKALIDGLNVAYEARERRGFVTLTLVSLGFTAGIIVAAAVGGIVLAAAPGVLASFGLHRLAGFSLLRWPALFVAAAIFFSVLYRYGPCRPRAHWRWITPGGVIAAAGWVGVSALFTWYVGNFGHYDRTYGSLGAIVGFLTWVWLSTMVLLFGAELNAAAETGV
jgi:membrane protein